MTITEKYSPAVEALKAELAQIEEKVIDGGPTLSDAIRLGSKTSTQVRNWGSGDTACALSAGAIGAAALDLVK